MYMIIPVLSTLKHYYSPLIFMEDILNPCYTPSFDLVGGSATPLKNMSSSTGMMTFPISGKIEVMFQFRIINILVLSTVKHYY